MQSGIGPIILFPSMLSDYLFARLFRQIKKGVHLVLTGDFFAKQKRI
jgi:hypothetical protein